MAVVLALTACASAPPARRDGPGPNPPPNLAQVADAVPRVESLRVGGPNKPYEVAGRRYVPMTSDLPLNERGGASWYGIAFHGRPTSLGETYDMYAMTAAHKTMPLPSYARVRNPANGREVIVRVNDRGPFVEGRVIDLSYTAALKLGLLGGVAPVEVQRLTFEDIRRGRFGASPREPGPGQDDEVPAERSAAAIDAGFLLQLGAFRERAGAEIALAQWRAYAAGVPVSIASEGGVHRVRAGPYPSREAAARAAQAWRDAAGLSPLMLPAAER